MIKVLTRAETSELDLLIWIKVVPPRYLFSFCVCTHFLQMSTYGDRPETDSLMMIMIMMVKMMMMVLMMLMTIMITRRMRIKIMTMEMKMITSRIRT